MWRGVIGLALCAVLLAGCSAQAGTALRGAVSQGRGDGRGPVSHPGDRAGGGIRRPRRGERRLGFAAGLCGARGRGGVFLCAGGRCQRRGRFPRPGGRGGAPRPLQPRERPRPGPRVRERLAGRDALPGRGLPDCHVWRGSARRRGGLTRQNEQGTGNAERVSGPLLIGVHSVVRRKHPNDSNANKKGSTQAAILSAIQTPALRPKRMLLRYPLPG